MAKKNKQKFDFVKMSFPDFPISFSRLSVFTPKSDIEAVTLLLYIYTYIYNNK